MKMSFHRLLVALGLLLSLGSPAALRADTSSPMFAGTTLDINGNTYEWQEPASEDGTWHYDTYNGPNGPVTVTGMIGFPDLAAVSVGGIDGHLLNGVYADNEQSWSEEGVFEANGNSFTHYSGSTSYYPDLVTGQLLSSGGYTYSGPAGSYSYVWDAYGGWSWSQSMSGSETGGTSPFCSHPSFELFGTTYSFTHNDSSWSQSSGGDSTPNTWSNGSSNSWTDHYASSDGGSFSISSGQYTDNTGVSMQGDTTISGWDPLAGNFAASQMGAFSGLEGLSWEPRTAPSFAPAQLWLDGTLVNWQWGEITTAGMVTDHYEQDGLTMEIVGHAREFQQGTSHATVTINGGDQGTLDGTGFHGNTSSIQTDEPEPEPDPDPGEPDPDPPIPNSWTDSSPFFTGTTSLWVDGTEYPFVQGYQDDTGHRTDTYENPSAGTVTLIGNVSDSSYAEAQVSIFGSIVYGHYSGGVFQTYYHSVSTTAPSDPDPGPDPDPVYGPDAFWVRGRLYARLSPDSSTFQSSGGHALSVGSPDGGTTLEMNGADAAGSFSGSFLGAPAGILFIHDHQNQPMVPVIAANNDGSLQLSGEVPFESLPPALMVSGRGIWQHLGTLPDGGTGNVAWYGNALGISGEDPAQGGGQLLGIHLDSGAAVVMLMDYLASSTATGSYSTTTHLFQTGVENSLPMPIYGVDPTANHALWGMSQPPEGLPDTFLVGNDVWRFTGADGNGARYQGYYTGQEMVIGVAGEDGLRLVSITDPVHGNTSGTLNDLRGSVRLRDGRMAYSGNFEGDRLNPVFNQNNLHTIAADLDITGNFLSFGALNQDAAVAGVTWQFADDYHPTTGVGAATLYNALGRPRAQWVWSRAADSNAALPPLPVMKLDAAHKLTLHDPVSGAAGVVLNPAEDGVSKIRGVLRVRPGGDIDMGEFTAGGQP
ncbi:MAG TPA: hypothetical protein DDZ88_12070 [Verrucomicrobiales bacterium]|nr:hypothetical protein [Verrucomicrobiales bacterium]